MNHVRMFGPEEYPLDIRDQLEEFLKMEGGGIDIVGISQSVCVKDGEERHFLTLIYTYNGQSK